MALADRAELAVRLTLDDRGFTGPLRRVQANLTGLQKATSNTRQALGRTGAALQRTAVIAAAAATGGFLYAVRAAGDFQDAFAGVIKTVEATPTELDDLRNKIRAMAREMPVAATELARIGETAGALGIHTQDIDEFIAVVAKLGVTTNLTTDEAAEALGKIGTILGLTGSEFEGFADVLVNLGNKGASTEAEIIEITKRFAAAGQQAGLSIPEILAFSSAIASAGAEPEAAGSSLSRLFGNLITDVATASSEGKAFAKVAGVSFKDFSKIVKNDTVGAMLLFLDNLKDLDKFAQQTALKDVGITNVRDRNAILLLAETYDKNLIPAIENAKDSQNALSTEAQKRFNTFNSAIQRTRNLFNDIGITVGDRLLPKIMPLLDEFATWVSTHGPEIDKFGDTVAEAFTGIVKAVRELPWDSIINGLKTAGAAAMGAIRIFTSLPKEVQAGLIGGFVVNKATGGLVTGIGQDVLGAAFNKILTGSFLGRGSTPANPLFVAPVGGGLGGPVAGGAGAFGTLARIALPLAAVAAVEAVRENISASTSATAAGIHDRQRQVLPTASIPDLRTQLAAIDTGIRQIQANPLLVLVQGSALTELQAMRRETAARLAAVDHSGYMTAQAAQNSVMQQQQAVASFRASERMEATAAADRRIIAANQARVALEQRMATDRVRAAIAAQRVANVTVNVSTSVSAGKVKESIKTRTTWTSGNAANRLGVQ